MQGTWIQSLIWEDSTCCEATEPVHPKYWGHALQQKQPLQWEAHAPQGGAALARCDWRKPAHDNKNPVQPKQWSIFKDDSTAVKEPQSEGYISLCISISAFSSYCYIYFDITQSIGIQSFTSSWEVRRFNSSYMPHTLLLRIFIEFYNLVIVLES